MALNPWAAVMAKQREDEAKKPKLANQAQLDAIQNSPSTPKSQCTMIGISSLGILGRCIHPMGHEGDHQFAALPMVAPGQTISFNYTIRVN